jgi:hypothetical protein
LALTIQPYRQEHERAVEDFNRRLRSGGAEPDLVFYEKAQPRWLPPHENGSMVNEFFLALDDGKVRGGYALKCQDFAFADGSVHNVGYYHHPLSEGIVDKRYAVVGGLLLRDAMQRSSLLYCLGMGGYDRPLPKMLIRLGWSHCLVPFYFRVLRPSRFLRQMQTLRSSPLRRFAMDAAAYSGAGWAAVTIFDAFRRLRFQRSSNWQAEVVNEFRDWADSLWKQSQPRYAISAVRDSATLQTLYSPTDQCFTRLRISCEGKSIGWAVTAERRKDWKYGALKVGSILDCWASPENAAPVIQAAANSMENEGMDLLVSNQSHVDWCMALERAGFLSAPSNFIFAASKKLGELLQPFDQTKTRMHFTRADGDGLPRNF